MEAQGVAERGDNLPMSTRRGVGDFWRRIERDPEEPRCLILSRKAEGAVYCGQISYFNHSFGGQKGIRVIQRPVS
jgi:hypothetical protein